jgi:hypothetical protein
VEYKTKHPLYNVWAQIIKRCVDPRTRNYRNYGGRGIRVCNRWVDDFWSFVADMGERPSRRHSVERIDNNGPYEPTNCRWATDAEQKLNTRRCKMVTRLRAGYSVETALTAAPHKGL